MSAYDGGHICVAHGGLKLGTHREWLLCGAENHGTPFHVGESLSGRECSARCPGRQRFIEAATSDELDYEEYQKDISRGMFL